MHYPRAPSSPPPTTTRHHAKEQTMHYSSSSPVALSPARPERLRDREAGHRRDNDVPGRDLAIAAYEDVTGASRGRHRRLGPTRYGAECGCFVTLRTVREYQAGTCSDCAERGQTA